MAIHTLTAEQVREFIDAVGGIATQSVTGGQFSTQQLKMLAESVLGLRNGPPRSTDDQKVNFAIDCAVACGDTEKNLERELEELYALEASFNDLSYEGLRAKGWSP